VNNRVLFNLVAMTTARYMQQASGWLVYLSSAVVALARLRGYIPVVGVTATPPRPPYKLFTSRPSGSSSFCRCAAF
jgi:hypothetical protein